jgi:hypothetical protein
MFLSAVGLSLTLAYLCVHMPTCPRQAMRLSHLREVRPALACGQLNENAGQGDVGPKPHQAVVAITPGRPQRAAFDANEVQGELAECEPMRRAACVNRPPAFATKTGLRVFEAEEAEDGRRPPVLSRAQTAPWRPGSTKSSGPPAFL